MRHASLKLLKKIPVSQWNYLNHHFSRKIIYKKLKVKLFLLKSPLPRCLFLKFDGVTCFGVIKSMNFETLRVSDLKVRDSKLQKSQGSISENHTTAIFRNHTTAISETIRQPFPKTLRQPFPKTIRQPFPKTIRQPFQKTTRCGSFASFS